MTPTLQAPPVMTPEEILHLWDIHVGDFTPSYPFGTTDAINFARAIIAKRDAAWAEVVRGVGEDARRYRWLRSNPEWLGWDHDFRPDEVERELDAALAARSREGGE